jgi:glutamyl-tRNA synthetase
MNGIYIRQLSSEQLIEQITPHLERARLVASPPTAEERAYLHQLVPLIHERLKELSEAPDLLSFFFQDISYQDTDQLIPKKMDASQTIAVLHTVHDRLLQLEAWEEPQLEPVLRSLTQELGLKTGQVFGAIRVAVTGRTVAPPLFETLAALGKERSISRISAAKHTLNNNR